MPLSYDLIPLQILGQKFVKFGIVVQTMTPKGHFEIKLPLGTKEPRSSILVQD